ncbi:MAG: HlyD family efflux transporter periplasmic adaptor subunit [Pseudomonadota bacterium]
MTGEAPKQEGPAKPGPRLVKTAPRAAKPEGGDGALRLLQLEADVRRAAGLRELIFHLANESRVALEFRQGLVLTRKRGRMRVEAISSVSALDRNAPMVRWIEAVVRDLEKTSGLAEIAALNLEGKAEIVGRDKDVYAFPHLLWAPIKNRKGRVVGGLIAAREKPWTDRLKVLAGRLSETYSHAWSALTRDRAREGSRIAPRLVAAVALAGVVAAGFIPVPITAIAPLEVAGRNAALVSAPIDGVVEEILVSPNQPVAAGAVLARIEDTELRNAAEIAENAVVVAAARLEALSSGAFASADARRDLAVARAELALAEAERDLARERLERVEMRAPTAGVAVYPDASEWIGRPVNTGERIMEIADPARVEYRISLAVDDLIALNEDAPVRVFLDSAPLDAREASLTRASYHASQQPDGTLAYELVALDGDAEAAVPRIGARGTAQVLGEDAPLAFVLFRRPVAWFRQTFGL